MERQRRYRRRASGIAVCLALLSGLSSCSLLGDVSSNSDAYQTAQWSLRGQVLVSKRLPIRLKLPWGWQPATGRSLSNNADLEAENPHRQMYLVVVGEDRTLVQFNQLTENAAEYRRLLTRGFSGSPQESQTDLTQLDNHPAVQYVIRGQVGSREVVYLHTTTQIGGKYYQIVVWTPADRYADNKGAMGKIVKGFQVKA